MVILPTSAHIEMEIRRLLKSGVPNESAVHKLVEIYGESPLSCEELQTLSIFFLYAGHYATLSDFLTKALTRGLKIPWAHYCEALFLSSSSIPETIKASVVRGADSQGQLEELARSLMLDHFDDRLSVLRLRRPKMHQEAVTKKREELLATLEMLQAQGLLEEEQKLLEKIRRMYPNDPEIERLNKTHVRQKTHDLLQEVKSDNKTWIPLVAYQKPNAEMAEILQMIESTMQEALKEPLESETTDGLAYNFAIAHVMWENYAAALEFTNAALSRNENNEHSIRWLRLEILFQLRHFIDILSELDTLETAWADDPQATFGILYLRAQVFWELGQKQQAIEVMESISIARPQYRNCGSLLAEWKGEAT